MHGDSAALVVLRRALTPSPLWAVEAALMTAAIQLSERGSKYNAPQEILRRSRERAAAASGPTAPPTMQEIAAALSGDQEHRTRVLVRLFISEMEDAITKGSVGSTEGGPAPPEVSRDP